MIHETIFLWWENGCYAKDQLAVQQLPQITPCLCKYRICLEARFEAEVRVQVNICFSLQVRTGVSLQILQLRFGEEIQVRSVQGLSRGDPQGL